jgi:tRNA(Ile)-lysidine synthase
VHKFVRNLITEWRRLDLPIAGERVIVAVSGGADSTALLLALSDLRKRKKLDFEFVVAHFNHKLRGSESDDDELFVKELAAEERFQFIGGAGSLKGDADLEQRARIQRYAFLQRVAEERNAALVLTGHTLNDQAETFLLNLIRGSGLDGLSAMPTIRTISEGSNIKLVRSLLRWAKREATEQFCRDNNSGFRVNRMDFRLDPMNYDPRFARVVIRKSILLSLAALNPKIVETLARTADLLTFSTQKNDHPATGGPSSDLKLTDLRKLNENEFYTDIRNWLREQRGGLRGITRKHIEAVFRLVKSPKSGRLVELPGGAAVVKSGGRLAFRHNKLEY